MRHFFPALCTVASLVLAAPTFPTPSFAGDIPAKPEPGVVKMSIIPWLGYGPWLIAQDKGYFKKEGLEGVDIITFNAMTEVFAAFTSGQVLAANMSSNSALLLSTLSDDVAVVMMEDFSLKADAILAGKDVKSIKDLKGKRVAYEEGDTSDVLLNYALKANGMSLDDIIKVPMSPAQAATAVIAGQEPVGVSYEPYLTTALSQNKDVRTLYTAGEDPGLISDVLVVSKKMVKEKPGQVLALVKAWDKAMHFYRAHTKEARAIIAKGVGASPEELETAFDGVVYYDLAENKAYFMGEYLNVTLPKVQDGMLGAKQIKAKVDAKALVDGRFVEAAGK
ncbi:ABC transporter substrate-binding protein [Xanthobacter wiegelii]|uniref:ABC transporter substrate-binding protein n=1 Tax=Xanthobacter wiegelii TaxID=3119913 RepID=UPI00372C89EE